MISEQDCNIDIIRDVLIGAYFEAVIDGDGEVYVKDGLEFPTWIGVLSDKKLIGFSTFIDFGSVLLDDDAISVCASKLTSKIVVPAFFAFGARLSGRYAMTYAGGISAAQLISMLRRFASAFALGVRNAEDELVSPPGIGAPKCLHS